MFNINNFITLKDDKWLGRQKIAGLAVSSVLQKCTKLIKDKIPNLSLKDLENEALKIIKEYNCIPTFLNYKPKYTNIPFPSAICTSVNNVLVHGTVSDYILQNGDKISIDLGATFEGAIADAAYTAVYGDSTPEMMAMLALCQKALTNGIRQAKTNNQIGAIGYAIYDTVKNSPFSNISNFGGHGLDYNIPHAQPFINNEDNKNNGVRIQPGLSIAIEPMVTIGNNSTYIGNDGWSVYTKTIGCHFEHSLFVQENQTLVITDHGMIVGQEFCN